MIRVSVTTMLALAAWIAFDPPPPMGDGRTLLAAFITTTTLAYYLIRSRTHGTN